MGCQLHFDLCQWRSNGRDECKHWRLGCPEPASGRIGDLDCPNHRRELYRLVAFSQCLWRSVRRDGRCGDYCRRERNGNIRTYGYPGRYSDCYFHCSYSHTCCAHPHTCCTHAHTCSPHSYTCSRHPYTCSPHPYTCCSHPYTYMNEQLQTEEVKCSLHGAV